MRYFGMRRAQAVTNVMLRITIHEADTVCRLELAGRLVGPWVDETEEVWRASLRSAKQIEVDTRQLTGVDDCGKRLLSAMHRNGVHLIAEGVWMTALIDEVVAGQPCNSTTRRPQRERAPRKPNLPGKFPARESNK